ncbi:hypothetical protein RhiJN_07992 [Ceratobasidium sp. AG-Ba]|nr:hypothetical protein RhiJN_07992 [Ceratobasidium sp. AG-Ba]
MFHINLLTPFTEDKDFHWRQATPPPIAMEEGEEEYKVDHMVAWEQQKISLYYQIRWKGYDPIEDTMERAEKIAEKPQIMEELLRHHPKALLPKKYKQSEKGYKRVEMSCRNSGVFHLRSSSVSSSPFSTQCASIGSYKVGLSNDPLQVLNGAGLTELEGRWNAPEFRHEISIKEWCHNPCF